MDESLHRLLLIRRVLAQRLESLQRAGVQQLGRVPSPVLTPAPAEATPLNLASVPSTPAASPAIAPTRLPTPSMPAAKRPPASSAAPAAQRNAASLLGQPYPRDLPVDAAGCQLLLDREEQKVSGCTLCRDLAHTRKQTVFGVGNPRPRVAFFGEAPGADEDRLGEPFVGRAGQLLTKIIEACGWQRSDVYILNVLKCRPPENRNPLPPEVDNCRPYFERQFEILRPEFIVCVGTVPAHALLETTESVGKLRGRFFDYRDSRVLVTYHPSYLLRNPAAKKLVWDDMQLLLKEMGLPVPKRGGG
jgi:uracil-DNA glycosylase